MKVSVLMPVLNGLPFLKDAIESILSQSFTDFEFIIVNDLSTDGTTELLNEFAKKDNRIRLLQNEKNMGIVSSLNRGLKECRGEYIVRMDADDIALKNRIEKQVEVMDSDYEIAALGTSVSYIDALGNELGIIRHCAPSNTNLMENPLIHPTVMIRRALLTQYGFCYKEKCYSAQDYFLWLELSKVGKIYAINEILMKYRITKDNSIIKKTKTILCDTLKAKKYAMFVLKIKPNLKDIGKIFLELLLLLLPARAIFYLYIRTTFRKGIKINL